MNDVEVLKVVVKKLEYRIKEVQKEVKDSYTQEDVFIKKGVEQELIQIKIWVERFRKSIN
jgi:hypothetical protein